MRRTLSCPSTFFWKYVFPAGLLGGVLYWLVGCWSGKFTFSSGERFPLIALLSFTLLGAAVVSAVIAATRKLKRVAVEHGRLCVSNYLTEVQIPLSDVAGIREYRGLNTAKQYTTVIVDLAQPCRFGNRIVFLPKPRLYWSGPHPVIQEFQGLCDQQGE